MKDLNLTLDPETQNYRYFLIEDVENSKTDLAYDRLGNLSQASRTESSVLSTRVKTYAKGKLVSDDTLPTVSSQTKNLMSELLAAASEAQQGPGRLVQGGEGRQGSQGGVIMEGRKALSSRAGRAVSTAGLPASWHTAPPRPPPCANWSTASLRASTGTDRS